MIDFYKYAEQYIVRKLKQAGLKKRHWVTENFHIDFWDTETEKPCIFLLNGFGAQAEFQWFKQVAVLQKNYRVVLVNLLYFGQSRPVHETCYEINDQLLFIESLRSALQLEKILIAGISYGGLVATEYTHKHPGHVQHLILIDAAVKYLTLEHLEKLCAQYDSETMEAFFAPADYKALRKQIRAAYFKPPFMPRGILKSCHARMCAPYRNDWLGLIAGLRSSMIPLAERHYDFDIKTSIFWGTEDEIIPLAVGEKLAKEFRSATLFTISKSGHLPNLERSKKFNLLFKKALA